MASVTNSPGTAANDATVGTVAWSSVSSALTTYALNGNTPSTNPTFTDVRLSIAGTPSGTNLATGAGGRGGTTVVSTFGSSTNTWGLSLTTTDVNNINFGVAYSLTGTTQSNFIKFTNFGFSIPTGAVINGVIATVTTDSNSSNTFLGAYSNGTAGLSLQVYYTIASTITGISSITGLSTITL